MPQVLFGGVPATNVHVNWDGELTADAPADPAGSATDQVVVTVSTSAGSSSGTGTPQVNEFTYAPCSRPTVTSISPASGAQLPSGSITIHGTNFFSGGTPIVDFGTVASVGSMSYGPTSITTTIPASINPGTVNVTVTTNTGTSVVTPADQSRTPVRVTSAAPAISSGSSATFSNGLPGQFDISTTGTPTVSSITDAAFAGCTPSALPASIKLVYAVGPTPLSKATHNPVTGACTPSASTPPTASGPPPPSRSH